MYTNVFLCFQLTIRLLIFALQTRESNNFYYQSGYMALAKLTKKFVEELPYTQGGQVLYFDTGLKGFGLRVGKEAKTYFAQKKINGRDVRTTIGKHGIFTLEEARKDAQAFLVDMSRSINPNNVKRENRIKAQTLQDVYDRFLEHSHRRLSPGTLVGYRDFMNLHFEQWKNKPITEISKDMVIKRHGQIGENSGHAAANNAMQFLRRLYNFARIDDETMPNPAVVLSQKKLWYRIDRRRTIIKDHQLSDWFKAVMELPNETARDVLRFLLFTGLRKSEALTLRWENVDLKAKTFLVPDTKNHIPLELPLSDYLLLMLTERKLLMGSSEWVFPGDGGVGHAEDVKKAVTRVIDASGVIFMPHDLRRTFITTAERLDISAYALKKLVNHKTSINDVTAGYIVMDVERLRDPMQKITNYLLQQINTNAEDALAG
jgi:integrase